MQTTKKHEKFPRGQRVKIRIRMEAYLSYDVASGSDILQWTKIDKPLVVYRFW